MNFFQYLSKHSLKSGEYTHEKPNAVLLSDNERLFQNVPDVFQLNGERFTKRFDDTLVDEIAQESVAVKRYSLLVYSSFPFRPVFIPLPYPSGIRTLENYLHSWSWFTQRPRNNTDYRNILSVALQPSINSGYTLFRSTSREKVHFCKNIDSCFVQSHYRQSHRVKVFAVKMI